MSKIILFDLDSTLADTRGRSHLGAEPPHAHEKWIEYSKACVDDPVLHGVATALRLYHRVGYKIFIISGRNHEALTETMTWLDKNGIHWDSIRLRKASDIQHNGHYKVAYVRELKMQGLNPVLMFEDSIIVSELVEAEGVPVVTVNPRYEDTIGVYFNDLAE